MKLLRDLGAASAVLALTGLAVPAQAQAWGHRHYRGHHGHGGVDGGDVLLGALLAGGLIAVASAASKPSAPPPPRADAPPPPPPQVQAAPPDEYDAPPPPPPGDGYDLGASSGYAPADAPPADEADAEGDSEGAPPVDYANITDPDSAADACAAATEEEGSQYARLAQVARVSAVEPSGSGWTVRGTVTLRDDYRSAGTAHEFRCALGNGAPRVTITGVAAH